jgi:hypothetical protein
MPLRSREAGFALPLTIFVLTLVTIMLAAIFVQVQVDRRIADSSADVVGALNIAQQGLNRYIILYDSLGSPPPDNDSLRLNTAGGYADVVARVIRNPSDSLEGVKYIIRSTGRLIKPTQGADPQAVRTVAQFAQWQIGSLDPLAAFTAINHFTAPVGPDGTFTLDGNDHCVPAQASLWGLRVPSGSTPALNPPGVVIPGMDESGFTGWVATATGIDWQSVVNGPFTPDYSTLADLTSWSSYRIPGDATFTDITGNGLMTVVGNLTIDGSIFDWQGVLLVGGTIVFSADTSRIHGAVVSGLQSQLGSSAPDGDWGVAGTHIEIRYYSCYVSNALLAETGFATIRGAWMDNWATY